MSRPWICRNISLEPETRYFKPRGIPAAALEEVCLTLDELEALRLADLHCYYQVQAAEEMGVSRQTFGNIIGSAHRKIADALVNLKALKIEGGAVKMVARNFVCYECRNEWSLPHGTGRPGECPKCGSTNIHRAPRERGMGRGGGRGMGRGGGRGLGRGPVRP